MTRRLLMLDDDELERVLLWYEAHEHQADAALEDEDAELAEKIRDARLAS